LNNIHARLSSGAVSVLTVLIALACLAGRPAQAQVLGVMEGSWRLTVSAVTPAPQQFPVLISFDVTGNVLSTRPGYLPVSPAGPLLEGTGHGAWRRQGFNEFKATVYNMLQGAPNNNQLAGALFATEKLNIEKIVISADGKTLTARWSSTFTDPAGNLLFTAGGTLTGTRILPD